MKDVTLTQKELKNANASDYDDKTLVFVTDNKTGDTLYIIDLQKGNFRSFGLKTTVQDKNLNYLDCTPGVRGGRPYYINDFINR